MAVGSDGKIWLVVGGLVRSWKVAQISNTCVYLIAAFYTQRPGNYSICLLEQKVLAKIFVTKTNQALRPFSTSTE